MLSDKGFSDFWTKRTVAILLMYCYVEKKKFFSWNAKEAQMFNKYFCSVLGRKTDDWAIFQDGNKIRSGPMQAWDGKLRAAPVKQLKISSSG